MCESRYIDGDPKPVKKGNLTSVDDFEINNYYWARYNCGFFIVQCRFDGAPNADKNTWVLIGDGCKHPIPMALKVFGGGIYGPLIEPYET
jgi:hypothetical protein